VNLNDSFNLNIIWFELKKMNRTDIGELCLDNT